MLVVPDDRAIGGHQFAKFAPKPEWILLAIRLHQHGIVFFLMFSLRVEMSVARRRLQTARILHRGRSGEESAKDARDQRIRAQAVCAVILVFAFACGINSWDV